MSKLPQPADSLMPAIAIAEVRYSLPQLLKEVEFERTAATFAKEKLDQAEIVKLFKHRTPPRRVKSKK